MLLKAQNLRNFEIICYTFIILLFSCDGQDFGYVLFFKL